MHIDYSPGEKNRTKPGQDRQIQKQQEKKRSCCQGVKAERVQGLRVCLRDSGGGKGGGQIVAFAQSSAGVGLRFGVAERERLKQKGRGISPPQGRGGRKFGQVLTFLTTTLDLSGTLHVICL